MKDLEKTDQQSYAILYKFNNSVLEEKSLITDDFEKAKEHYIDLVVEAIDYGFNEGTQSFEQYVISANYVLETEEENIDVDVLKLPKI